ncbi:MAG: hypothetical protein H8E24_00145, partial [Verrucomicrobia bacterium]|nr:hypothetical protein [Verrucomicrobiota bacterium]
MDLQVLDIEYYMTKVLKNRSMLLLFALVCTVTFGSRSKLIAQAPEVGYVYPPFVQRGTSTSVQLGGYDFTPDLQIMVHSTTVALLEAEQLGEFLLPPRPYWEGPRIYANALPIPREMTVVLSPNNNTELGRVSWQIANANGVSKRGLFYVSDMVEQVESRFRSELMELGKAPIAVSGRIRRLTEKDNYGFTASKTGEVSLGVFARRVGSDFYPAVQVYGPDGVELVNEVDTEGRDLDLKFLVQKGKQYRIVIHDSDFRGAAQFVYRLLIEHVETGTKAAETEGGDRRRFNGTLDKQAFSVTAGREYEVRAVSISIGGDLDVSLQVMDGEGKLIAENDDVTPELLDAQVRFVAKVDGELNAVVTGSSVKGELENRFYELHVKELERGFELTTPATVVAAVGSKLSIPVTLISTGGFAGEVQLKVRGLPDGVTIDGDAVIPTGKKKGTVGLLIADNAQVKGTVIEIIGESAGDAEKNLPILKVVASAA